MRNKLFLSKEEYTKFFNFVENTVDNTKDKQLTKFLRWCFNKGFFDNITNEDIDDCYEYGELSLPLLKNHHITIGVECWKGYDFALIGLDPSDCFNKTKHCSIVAKLPILSKREETRFYKVLETVLDKKSPLAKEWRRGASTCWNGEYGRFNY